MPKKPDEYVERWGFPGQTSEPAPEPSAPPDSPERRSGRTPRTPEVNAAVRAAIAQEFETLRGAGVFGCDVTAAYVRSGSSSSQAHRCVLPELRGVARQREQLRERVWSLPALNKIRGNWKRLLRSLGRSLKPIRVCEALALRYGSLVNLGRPELVVETWTTEKIIQASTGTAEAGTQTENLEPRTGSRCCTKRNLRYVKIAARIGLRILGIFLRGRKTQATAAAAAVGAGLQHLGYLELPSFSQQ